MRARLTVFLDDGGVMNDNGTRASQWQHLVSEFFTPHMSRLLDKEQHRVP
ncbi:MAG TPA: hypothetical protein VF026_22155 [Ktedonobacteraceae bacterium]